MKRFPALVSALLALGATALSAPSAIAQDFPINHIVFIGMSGNVRIAEMVVPDSDTTRSAYGGRLRRYDVHVAKLFELTNYECNQPERNWNRIIWRYKANGGDTHMGAFDISCSLARDIATAYGTGKTEATSVTYYRARATINVPILSITGNKIDSWLRFTQNFRPESID